MLADVMSVVSPRPWQVAGGPRAKFALGY